MAANSQNDVEFMIGDTVKIIGGECAGKQGILIDRANSPGFWHVRVPGQGDWVLYRSVMMLGKKVGTVDVEIDPHAPGAKLDSGKPLAGVLLEFSRALEAVVAVGTFGANKYSRSGWMSVQDGERRYTDAMMRHLLKHGQGEEFDPEHGIEHLAAVIWNACAALELRLRREEA